MVILLYRKGTIAKSLYLAGPTKLERGKELTSPQHLQKITAFASTNQNFANNFKVFYKDFIILNSTLKQTFF
jgi:hypothetical protein